MADPNVVIGDSRRSALNFSLDGYDAWLHRFRHFPSVAEAYFSG
jgi:hypothetical protein